MPDSGENFIAVHPSHWRVTSQPSLLLIAPNWIFLTSAGIIHCMSTFHVGDIAPGINSSQKASHSGFSTHESGKFADAVSLITRDSKHCWCAGVQSMLDPTLLPHNMVHDTEHPMHLCFGGSDTIYSGRTGLGCELGDGSCWGELRKVIGNIKGEYKVGGPRSMLVCGSSMASCGGRSTEGLWGSTTELSEIVEGTGGPRPRKLPDISWGWPNSLLKALWCVHQAGKCPDWAKVGFCWLSDVIRLKATPL